MEKGEVSDTNKTELSHSPIGEEMNKLIESMDPQGLLNMGDQDEGQQTSGVDLTRGGDAHAAEHEVSLTDNGSECGGEARSGSGPGGSEHNGSETGSENMEVCSPGFRIVDIQPRVNPQSLQSLQPLQSTPTAPSGVTSDLDPNLSSRTDGSATAPVKAASPETPVFAIPSKAAGDNSTNMPKPTIMGRNIFESSSSGNNPFLNPAKLMDPKSKTPLNNCIETKLRKIPTGVKAPTEKDSLPPKKQDPVEPDAVPSKTYDAILTNKKKKEKAGTIGGIASGQGPTECGSFFNKGDNRILRSV
jgi:hypothetical protein